MPLDTIDVPQADSLALVRRVVQAVRQSASAPVKVLAEQCGFSERHVRYRLQAARVLGLVVDDKGSFTVTARGSRLLRTDDASAVERKQLRRAVADSTVLQQLVPELLKREQLDLDVVAARITRASGLSRATAERRASGFRSWHRYLNGE